MAHRDRLAGLPGRPALSMRGFERNLLIRRRDRLVQRISLERLNAPDPQFCSGRPTRPLKSVQFATAD